MRTRPLMATMVLLLAIPVAAKGKKSQIPEEVLRAETIYVMIRPDTGMSVTNPGENRAAREAVEQALRKWGRFRVLTYVGGTMTPDLIIVVRKGGSKTTITGADPNDRPGTISSDEAGINIGVSRGTPPAVSSTTGTPPTGRPGLGTEVAPAEDVFEVYLAGARSDPLDVPAIWRYLGKNALNPPVVPAVREFQKFIETAQKKQTQNKKQP